MLKLPMSGDWVTDNKQKLISIFARSGGQARVGKLACDSFVKALLQFFVAPWISWLKFLSAV